MTNQREDSTDFAGLPERLQPSNLPPSEMTARATTPQDSPEARIARYYATGDYYQGTVMDRERQVPVAMVNMAVPGAKTQSGVDGAAFIADLLNQRSDLLARLHEQAQEIERLKSLLDDLTNVEMILRLKMRAEAAESALGHTSPGRNSV